MTDLPVAEPPAHAIPKDGDDDEEKKARTLVSVSSRIVADGSTLHDGVEYARMTLVMRPTSEIARPGAEPPSSDSMVNLRCWPSEIMKKYFTPNGAYSMKTKVRVVAASGLSKESAAAGLTQLRDRAKLVDAEIMWTSDHPITERVDRFWSRMMNAPPRLETTNTIWERLVQALTCNTNETTSVILPTPQAAAALAFTLERGRMVLDALASPNSPLATRGRLSREVNLADCGSRALRLRYPHSQARRLRRLRSLSPRPLRA